MSERDAFVRRICEEPAEDTHRLVFADWLEENGDPGRAEFVRLQVEIARTETPGAGGGPGFVTLGDFERVVLMRDRVNSLIRDRGFGWCDGVLGPSYKTDGVGKTGDIVVVRYARPAHPDDDKLVFTFRRGFQASAWTTTPTFVRHAASLFSTLPLEHAYLSDRRPRPNGDAFTWLGPVRDDPEHVPDDENRLPGCLWLFLLRVDYPTEDEAFRALSKVCVLHGRYKAGLPILVAAPRRV